MKPVLYFPYGGSNCSWRDEVNTCEEEGTLKITLLFSVYSFLFLPSHERTAFICLTDVGLDMHNCFGQWDSNGCDENKVWHVCWWLHYWDHSEKSFLFWPFFHLGPRMKTHGWTLNLLHNQAKLYAQSETQPPCWIIYPHLKANRPKWIAGAWRNKCSLLYATEML